MRQEQFRLSTLQGALRAFCCAGLLLGFLSLHADAAEFPLPAEGTIVGEVRAVTVESNATLYDIARHYDLGFEEVEAVNPGVNAWVPGQGQRIVLPTSFILPPKPWSGIIVNLAARRLYYFPKPTAGQAATVITFPLGIGRLDWETPLGNTRIVAKVRNPSWVVPKNILAEHELNGNPLPPVIPPGPNNPMGLLALQTGFPSVFIHGTNEPWGVGGLVSHGCMHLYPEDVAALFDRVPVGTPLRVIDEPGLVGERDGKVYLAAFKPSRDGTSPAAQRVIDAVAAFPKNPTAAIDWNRVREVAAEASQIPTEINAGTADSGETMAGIPAQPYRDPPYGTDANAAAPPGTLIE